MIRAMKAVITLALAVSAFVTAAQQRPARDAEPQALRIVRGDVRADDDSAAALRRARVTVAGSTGPAVYTNQEGEFELTVPAAGNSVLRISKPGFAPAQVVVNETVDAPIAIRLPRGAAIVARVFDDFGTPAVGVDVRVRRIPAQGERGRAPIDVRIATDDLGEFRVGSLPAGSYQLAIDAQGAQDAPEPARVSLRQGEESAVSLFYRSAAEEARRAASYVAGFEAGQRDALRLTPRRITFETGVVLGRVMDLSGRPVAGAIVRLNPVSSGMARLGGTDSQGRFQIFNVGAGAYRIAATKTGLVAAEYGQDRTAQPGRIVALRDRQRLDGVDIAMPRGAVVSGFVTDPDGEPMEGLAMHVWRARYWNGRRIAEAVADVAVRRTDDHGRYRLHGLQPGTYYVVASDDPTATSREVTGAPRSFYPGTPTIGEASTVTVDVGVDADAAHVVFNPARSWRVSGFAMDSEGHPLETPLVLAGSTRSGVATAPQVARMAGYEFAFDHVMPGSYVIHAIQKLELPDRLLQEFGSQFLDVGEYDVENLRVATVKGSTVTGRILTEGDGPGRDIRFGLLVVSADPDFAPPPGQFLPWTVRLNPDRSFEVSGLSGPVRFTSTSPPDGWFLQSVEIGGRNAADEPVTFGTPNDWRGQVPVIFSRAGGQVAGRVVNGRNEPVASYVVAAFPVDRNRWYSGSRYLRTARPDPEGRFTIGMLPPGEYWVAAVDALPDGALEDPELLAQLQEFGERVALSPDERLSRDLRLVTFRR
jgi:protocatechuate 3,4-dioxygenase beta subunit